MSSPSDPSGKLGDLADTAGLRRIHVLAWRDLADVEAGGSEVHLDQVTRRWAEAGVDVLVRTSHAQGQLPTGTRHGYQIHRRSGRQLFFLDAPLQEVVHRVRPSHRDRRADALLEVWNGMPFFTPLWARGPRVTFIHHVHDEMWRQALTSRKAQIGEVIELKIAPVVYRNARVLTPSDSSRRDIIEKLRLRPERVSAVPNGIDARFTSGGERSPVPLVAVVGRLVPHKRVDAVLRAVAELRATHPTTEVVVVGDGYDRDRLSAVAAELGGWNWVHFAGRVSDDHLIALYRRAWVVASASTAEGWGMAITEAAACGTTAVAARIPGHVDVIVDGETGILTDTDDDLTAALGRVIGDAALRDRLAAGALARAATYTWDRTAYEILEALADEATARR